MKMDIFKPIRLRRMDKARERAEREREEEGKRIAEAKEKEEREKKEREYKEALEKAKKLAPDLLLTISADIYVKGKGKKLTDYECKSIDGGGFYERDETSGLEDAVLGAKKEIIDKMKELEAEIIVDVKPTLGYSHGYKLAYFIGTALIPKEKSEC